MVFILLFPFSSSFLFLLLSFSFQRYRTIYDIVLDVLASSLGTIIFFSRLYSFFSLPILTVTKKCNQTSFLPPQIVRKVARAIYSFGMMGMS